MCGGRGKGGVVQLLAETVAFSGADFPEQREERMRRMDGWLGNFFFFSYGEEGLVLKARGEGGEARLMEITFHSIWRKGEGEKKMSLK